MVIGSLKEPLVGYEAAFGGDMVQLEWRANNPNIKEIALPCVLTKPLISSSSYESWLEMWWRMGNT